MLDQLSDLQNKVSESWKKHAAKGTNVDGSQQGFVNEGNIKQTCKKISVICGINGKQHITSVYNPVASDQMAATTHAQQVNGFIPGWML
ncbi:hypothetical protein DITRI_Ditri11bG0027400 [Diplodiscus trichospermus]